MFKVLFVFVFPGSSKHHLHVQLPQDADVLTVAHLSTAVAEVTQVPEKHQKLIFKGLALLCMLCNMTMYFV